MKRIRHGTIDWEPATIYLVGSKKPRGSAAAVRRAVEKWISNRSSSTKCDCYLKYLNVEDISATDVRIAIEWCCERCLALLESLVEAEFPWVEQFEFGVRESARSVTPLFIEVPAKTVTFEDGSKVLVEAFSVQQSPVSVAQFEQFTNATNYVTTAEKHNNLESFKRHFGLSGLSAKARGGAPANNISFSDAQAYCVWAGVRLPTEAEFLAASIVDPTIYRQITEPMLVRLRDMPNALILGSSNITSTWTPERLVVIRAGPRFFLLHDWISQVHRNRLLRAPDFYDITTEFHVCKLRDQG